MSKILCVKIGNDHDLALDVIPAPLRCRKKLQCMHTNFSNSNIKNSAAGK